MLLLSRFSATFGLNAVFTVADRRCCFDSLEAERVVLAIDYTRACGASISFRSSFPRHLARASRSFSDENKTRFFLDSLKTGGTVGC